MKKTEIERNKTNAIYYLTQAEFYIAEIKKQEIVKEIQQLTNKIIKIKK